jgi:hypothetical protein
MRLVLAAVIALAGCAPKSPDCRIEDVTDGGALACGCETGMPLSAIETPTNVCSPAVLFKQYVPVCCAGSGYPDSDACTCNFNKTGCPSSTVQVQSCQPFVK